MEYDEFGRELPDPRPIAIPAHLRMPESLADTMKRLIRVEMSRQAEAAGMESFEEADDFEPDDPEDLLPTPYEMHRLQEEAPPGVLLPKEVQPKVPANPEDLPAPAAAAAAAPGPGESQPGGKPA